MSQPASLAATLQSLVIGTLDDLVARHLPDLRIPGTFAGHPVEPDVAADLVFTLGLLADGGVTRFAGRSIDDAIATVLRDIDGPRTHTFFSYRVAETLARFGPFADNTLVAGWPDADRANLVAACDSTEWISLLDHGLPRNYAAVLARCEMARAALGLLDDATVLDELIERTRAMLAVNPHHYLDDSTNRVGRYDIYSADVWLFTEPLADRLGDLWSAGLAAALDLVEVVGSTDGTAVPWGRSTGVLAGALTIELGALALGGDHGRAPGPWLRRLHTATDAMAGWFDDGLVNAHQHRSPYGYRGPFRRLQLTLDVLGKLAWSAARLAEIGALPEAEAWTMAPDDQAWPAQDALVRFEDDRAAGVWAHRRPHLELTLPFVGALRSDYLAAPRSPGLFEVPVDSDIPCWVPLVVAHGHRWSPAGLPVELEHRPDEVEARWSGFTRVGDLDPPADQRPLAGECRASWRVEGRSVVFELHLTFDVAPDAVTVIVPETRRRPLAVESSTGHLDSIDVDGIKEWRSFWSELPRVHQVDLEPSEESTVSIRVTPALRVASTAHGHHYHQSLYDPMGAAVVSLRSPVGPFADRRVDLDQIDLFHLHWPEWLAFDDIAEHRRIIAALSAHGVPIVWTAHNLTPHDKQPDVYDPIYQLWAEAADAVIHQSHWGASLVRTRYAFPPSTRHEVIPHGHFGDLWAQRPSRQEAEDALGLPPCRWRIGLVGAPREEKRVVEFLDGFASCARDDLHVVCWSLRPDEEAPDDPRIVIAEPYETVDEPTYARRLAACDLLALPFDEHGEMLATGVAADVVGLGLAALVTEWPYLTEVLGPAGIVCGWRADEVRGALDDLTDEQVVAARDASVARRDEQSWARIARDTLALFEAVVAEPPSPQIGA